MMIMAVDIDDGLFLPQKTEEMCVVCGTKTPHMIWRKTAYCVPCGDNNAINEEKLEVDRKVKRDTAHLIDVTGIDIDVLNKAKKEAKEPVKIYGERICEMIDGGVNLMLAGSVGTGKTTLAVALAIKASSVGYSVECVKAHDMIKDIRAYMWQDLLIVDELHTALRMYGDKPDDDEKSYLYRLVEHRNNKKLSTIYITNQTNKVMNDMFGFAIMDRIRNRCIMVSMTGESHRKEYNIYKDLGKEC